MEVVCKDNPNSVSVVRKKYDTNGDDPVFVCSHKEKVLVIDKPKYQIFNFLKTSKTLLCES